MEVTGHLVDRQTPCRQRHTISSIPVRRRCRFLTIYGANEDSVSRGTSISTRPISVSDRLRAGAVAGVAAAGDVVFAVAEVPSHLRFQRGLEDILGKLLQQPIWAHRLDSLLLGLTRAMLSAAAEFPSSCVRSAVPEVLVAASLREKRMVCSLFNDCPVGSEDDDLVRCDHGG